MFILLIIPSMVNGQSTIGKRYVDDRINNLTYLEFNRNATFKYSYAYDLMHDYATGRYRLSNDTIYLFYNKSPAIEALLTPHTEKLRADTLVLKGKMLFKVRDGVSEYYSKPIVIDSKTHKGWRPPESWHYRRKYLIFGPYESTRRGRYYMIDERYAYWNVKK
jgi:hypothetical protein